MAMLDSPSPPARQQSRSRLGIFSNDVPAAQLKQLKLSTDFQSMPLSLGSPSNKGTSPKVHATLHPLVLAILGHDPK